jgi:hypothetical protein
MFALVLAGGGACRHAASRAAHPIDAPVAAGAPVAVSGAVSVSFLVPDGAAPPELAPGQRLVAPFPMVRPMPEYPPEALVAAGPAATVAVRILIDTSGRVAQVADSPLAASTPGPFAPLFRAAVEAALAGWEFYAAHLDTMREKDSDGDGTADDTELVQFTPVEVYYDLSFEFSVVDGQGTIRFSAPRAP